MPHNKAEMETFLEGGQLWIIAWQSSLLGFLCQQDSLWICPLKFWEKLARGVPKEPLHWELLPSVIILWSSSKAHLPLRRSQGCWLPWTTCAGFHRSYELQKPAGRSILVPGKQTPPSPTAVPRGSLPRVFSLRTAHSMRTTPVNVLLNGREGTANNHQYLVKFLHF